MSAIFEITENGHEKYRLGDAFDKAPERVIDEYTKCPLYTDGYGTGGMVAAARQLNRSLRNSYQAQVRETDHGTPICMQCIAIMKRQEMAENAPPIPQQASGEEQVDSYNYDPLHDSTSIRVLELAPAAEPEAPLQATLITERRESAQYVALSYTWTGASTNGVLHLGEAQMSITGNLDLALRALRLKDEVLRIWVDAVCINQQDLKEKAIQVARMEDVYTRAEAVQAWLGPASETSADALEFLEVIAELSKSPEYDQHVRQQSTILEFTNFNMDEEEATQIQETRASAHVDEILERLWFTRLWVIQEVLLAPQLTLHIGPHTMPWSTFRRAIQVLWAAETTFPTINPSAHKNSSTYHALGLTYARDQLQANNAGTTLFQDYTMQIYGRAKDFRRWGCKDDRDRVFGILGFIPSDSNMSITPDYTVDASEIYTSFARQHVLHEGLTVLMFAGLEQRHGPSFLELCQSMVAKAGTNLDSLSDSIFDSPDFFDNIGLPTWVPELRPDRMQLLRRCWLPQTFAAALDRTPAVVLHKNCPHIIAVRGKVFDSINTLIPTAIARKGSRVPDSAQPMSYVETMVYLSFVWRFSRDHYEEIGGYPTGDTHDTVFDSVVTAERTSGKLANLAKSRDPGWIDYMLAFLKDGAEHGAISAEFSRNPNLHHDASLFFSCLSFMMDDDHCVITEQGYMGLAPRVSQAGDRIAWINGLQSFVVLRRVAEGRYHIVGPCFLHGIMHGELFGGGAFADFEEEFIEII